MRVCPSEDDEPADAGTRSTYWETPDDPDDRDASVEARWPAADGTDSTYCETPDGSAAGAAAANARATRRPTATAMPAAYATADRCLIRAVPMPLL
jgi:hypothetical protein